MPEFKKGDKVRVVKGHNKGDVGVVTNPYFQISQSDWPFVLYVREDGTRGSADDSNMELIEDPTCEYAIQRTLVGSPEKPRIVGDCWATRAETNEGLLSLTTEKTIYKLVKRKKAGPIEEA